MEVLLELFLRGLSSANPGPRPAEVCRGAPPASPASHPLGARSAAPGGAVRAAQCKSAFQFPTLINRLFNVSGGHTIFDSNPLQRFHRDANAASRRTGLPLDFGGPIYGRAAIIGE